MIRIILEVAATVAVFAAGKEYGARVEAEVVALALKARSALTVDSAAAYKTVVADISSATSSALARVKKFL